MMRWPWLVTITVLAALSLSPDASAGTPDRTILGFAPADTDMVFYTDLDALTQTLTADPAPPSQGAIARLQQLRASLPFDVLKKLHVAALCTFHVRDTDHQLVVFELDAPLPGWVAKAHVTQVQLNQINGRNFVVFSLTPELLTASTWSEKSRLTPSLASGAAVLLGHRYWSVVEPTPAVRARMIANTGTIGGGNLPELQQLQQIGFTGNIVASNDIALEIRGTYATPDEAAALGVAMGHWLPFPNPRVGSVQGAVVKFELQHVSFQQLNAFLSHF
jgi:hypothetical protein